jgi:DMSO/TMAO reductase YedYZ molybdopterin-dependent catalytic subunit
VENRVRSVRNLQAVVVSAAIVTVVGTAWAQAPESPAALTVRGEVKETLKLSVTDLERMPRQTVRARDHAGKESEFTGVALGELIARAGAPHGEQLKGPSARLYALVEATDGYAAVFALPELDPAFTDRVVLLADHRDGEPISAKEGPLRVVVPGEKRHARWVRNVTAVTVHRAPAPELPGGSKR